MGCYAINGPLGEDVTDNTRVPAYFLIDSEPSLSSIDQCMSDNIKIPGGRVLLLVPTHIHRQTCYAGGQLGASSDKKAVH